MRRATVGFLMGIAVAALGAGWWRATDKLDAGGVGVLTGVLLGAAVAVPGMVLIVSLILTGRVVEVDRYDPGPYQPPAPAIRPAVLDGRTVYVIAVANGVATVYDGGPARQVSVSRLLEVQP